ncbi:MAG: hypothetical protein A2268_11345 [Candidatus Raymondbacteria bacterium RifOxyA12_full_50_37]|uniref:Peptidase M24 n=1 Tax=Candidatus Raymondbacteria bacterium RIFOXYD12_FULL_49_13 TaxID=1817890 RepID=A0A1F7FAX5_UNCRA|nr:MAG: hypothetical protein A2268_11345 [Candidatus Raymondbacteria bacterium RifOxyA12_full_50_37]OGJ91548.1 MAG: hypothetical protein A2350_08185 [Candidatus Raymondbacteria bacterium RifOxyB12_full_50_8]OGJ92368.1 MAG: hypothetical protein A2248_10470 [Candidatus Raymondbacteria bacterium RIFOXYA2_FULL_49_16]OGJ99349.1 MAG: hypothetical protein A2453_13530 [Candidatus Raymondbacteria bacterium RIFOXYC2_FULL_50_21]OGK03636.1 MAG: hypothetical protein A2519_02595 [Candidatus Raymondbacteria b
MSFIPETELTSRVVRLQKGLGAQALDGAFIFDKISLLYFTGTMANGAFFVPATGEPVYFVRRNPERALLESSHNRIIPYKNFKDISAYLAKVGHLVANIGINEGAVTVSFYKMLQKNVPQSVFSDIGQLCARLRAVKSEYELNKMKKAGELSREIYALIPGLIKLGMSEWELGLLLFQESAKRGLNCMSRVAGGNEFFFGNISFGENSLYPSAFDGPGGIRGRSPACPFLGSDRTLKAGDLIYIDMVTPCDEYYIDKTRVYSAGKPSQKAIDSFQKCCAIQDVVRDMLKPNVTPSYIYNKIYKEYIESDPEFAEHFMGYRQNQVKFLGHGIGIVLDEYPVIADKFNLPLEASMTIAVEPKKGIEGIGMVGIEDTFIVSPNGGINITEDFREIIVL